MEHLLQRTNHVKYILLDALSLVIATGPVIAGAAAMLGQKHILRVEQILDVRVLDRVDDPAEMRIAMPQRCVSALQGTGP